VVRPAGVFSGTAWLAASFYQITRKTFS
jgi:hypothetical protein